MKVVIDTNIIFSSLLSRNSHQREKILSKEFKFYSPKDVFVELFKHKEKIMRYTKVSEREVYEYLTKIIGNIRFVDIEFISPENCKIAYELCKNIDEADTLFVALAIALNALLWTGDKKLKNGLNRQGFNRFFQ